MTATIAGYGILALGAIGFALMLLLFRYNAKKEGADQQRTRDINLAVEAEKEINKVGAEDRATAETRKRMKGGTF